MSVAKPKPGQRIFINENPHRIRRLLDDNQWLIEEEMTGKYSELALPTINKMYVEGKLTFDVSDYMNDAEAMHDYYLEQSFDLLPEEMREQAKMRFAYVSEIDNQCIETLTKRTLTPLIEYVSGKLGNPQTKPHWVTLCRWYRRFVKGGRDIRVLISQNGKKGNRTKRADKRTLALVAEAIDQVYLSEERGSIQAVIDRAYGLITRKNRNLPPSCQIPLPSYTMVRNEILAIPEHDRDIARFGSQYTMRKYRMAGKGPVANRPLERVEIDHTILDVLVLDDKSMLPIGRPTFTVCFDVYSKCILGMYIGWEPPGYTAVANCLKHAFCPKIDTQKTYGTINEWDCYGVMETLVMDNAFEFHGHPIESVSMSFGVILEYCKVRTPWQKGGVERFIGTMNKGLIHTIPGTTFSNIFEKFDYKPDKHAVMTLSELTRVITKWIVDDYHQRIHRTTRETPAERWKRGMKGALPPVPSSIDALDCLVGLIDQRTVSHKGIELNLLKYNSEELRAMRKALGDRFKATVRYNTSDLGFIYVIDPRDDTPIKVPCTDAEYASGLSLLAHRLCREYAKTVYERKDIEALAEAKLRLYEEINGIKSKARRKPHKKKARVTKQMHRAFGSKSTEKKTKKGSPAKTTTTDSTLVGASAMKRLRLVDYKPSYTNHNSR